MKKPFAVVFAGVPGSSKTIVSNYLSGKFNLPVFNNDQLRFEVKEDMMLDNINLPEALAEYEKRHTQRLKELLNTRHSFILDGSVDRRWKDVKQLLENAGYNWYVIDMELSEDFLKKFFIATGRPKFLDKLPAYLEQHKSFMKKYSADISLIINDEDFLDRIKLAADGLRDFINS